MKILLYIFSLPLILMACQSKTYYRATNVNHQRFGGWRLNDAQFLAQSHDQVRLIEIMAATAMERSERKDTYFKAKEIHKITDQLVTKYRIEALKHRIKLASALSKPSDEELQKLNTGSIDDFDNLFARNMQIQLKELSGQLQLYKENGKTEGLVDFAARTLVQIEKVATELNAFSLQQNKNL